MNNQQHHQHQQNDDIPAFWEPILQFLNSLPPITRTWFSLSLLVTTLHTLDIFNANQLLFVWDRITTPQLELWRIVTSFTWAGPGTLLDFQVLMLLYSMVAVVPSYERDPHDAWQWQHPPPEEATHNPSDGEDTRDRTMHRRIRRHPVHRQADCIFAFLSCALLILLTYLLVAETSVLLSLLPRGAIPRPLLLPVFTRTLLYSIITLDSLQHPEQQQNINFFPVPGKYVPLFHVAFGLLMGYRVNETIHGIAVGVAYAYLVQEEGWPASALGRARLLSSPQWIAHLVGEDDVWIVGDVVPGGLAQRGTPLESGATVIHHAAAIGDITFLRSEMHRRAEAATSTAEMAAATAPFRQPDRNGWQPLHEAARAGRLHVLVLLLEAQGDEDEHNESERTWRRRAGRLKVNVNARTNSGTGVTALRLVEQNHGEDNECAALLRQVGGLSVGHGEVTEEED